LPDVSERLREELPKRATHFAPGDLLRMLAMLVEIEPHLKRSGQQQMLFETLLVRFALLDRTVTLEDVLKGMGSGESGAPSARTSAAAPPARVSERPSARASEPARGAERSAPPARSGEPARVAPQKAHSAPSARLTGPNSEPVVEAAASAAPALADAAPAPRALLPLELNRVVEHWDEIVDSVVRDGRAVLGAALGHATPTAVTASGTVTLTVDASAEAELIEQGSQALLSAMKRRFEHVAKLNVKAAAGDAAPRRLNEGAVKADRIAMLRKQSKLLDAAVDALDLELMD
jgi:DNA polymerase-3 subunit gamma/tau